MYICNNCSTKFCEAKSIPTSMCTYYECPSCGEDDYRELTASELTYSDRIRQHRTKTLEQRISYIEDKLNIIE